MAHYLRAHALARNAVAWRGVEHSTQQPARSAQRESRTSSPPPPAPQTPPHNAPRLSSIYNMLRKIRVFKHYYIFKSFSHWRKLVRRLNYRRVRKEIGRQLFHAVS